MNNKYYYWLDVDAGKDYWGDDTFALYCGELDEDGNAVEDTEEIILRAAYVDLPGYEEACHTYTSVCDESEIVEVDIDKVYDLIEAYMKEKLGFVPDYD